MKENEGVVEDMDAVMAPQEIGRAQFIKKNWDQAARAAHRVPNELELEGVMHITKRRHAFFTGKSYLSNFYQITIKFNGKVFQSSEQAYQYEKASVCRDSVKMDRIYQGKTPREAKDIGGEVQTTPLWERLKEHQMREIFDTKFIQNAKGL